MARSKLKSVGSGLAVVSTSRLMDGSKVTSREAERYAETETRRLYSTKRWKDLKREIHIRDGYRCVKTGVLLVGPANAPNSPICDHIQPHRGDLELFWEPSNLQTVSKEYHDKEKQKQEVKERFRQ